MNQQVNLYLPELRPSKEWLNASRLLSLTLAAVLIMAVISGYEYWRLNGLRSEQSALQARVEAQARETEALERTVAERTVNRRLELELETRQSRLQRTRNLLGFLEDIRLGNTAGFSTMMKDLSRASFEGLWLTGIQVQQGGDSVTLSGMARESAMVPDFIGRLSNGESILREKRFNRLMGSRAAGVTGPASEAAAGDGPSGYQFQLETR